MLDVSISCTVLHCFGRLLNFGVPSLSCLKVECFSLKVMIKACLLHQEVPRDDLEPRSHDSTYSGKVFHVFNPRSPSTLEWKDWDEGV